LRQALATGLCNGIQPYSAATILSVTPASSELPFIGAAAVRNTAKALVLETVLRQGVKAWTRPRLLSACPLSVTFDQRFM
jgi:hypothetical protein